MTGFNDGWTSRVLSLKFPKRKHLNFSCRIFSEMVTAGCSWPIIIVLIFLKTVGSMCGILSP